MNWPIWRDRMCQVHSYKMLWALGALVGLG
jgi:hypothetical protein